jgi:two-component system, chemotaxis family, chemotaxis protein CheY
MTANVMVIDDDPDLRETLKLLLAETGFGVTVAAGGQEAMDLLRKGLRPELILLDLMMPGMNGWQFLDRIRDTNLGSIPVVIMTARPVVGPLPAPARELLRKPFDRATLLGTIARCATPAT